MNTLFRNILTASFHGSIVILAVMLLRLVLKKTPRKYICLLWLLAGLRLLMPFQIQSDLSLQPSADPVAQVQQQISRSQTPAAPEDFSPADLDVPAPVQTPEALPDIQTSSCATARALRSTPRAASPPALSPAAPSFPLAYIRPPSGCSCRMVELFPYRQARSPSAVTPAVRSVSRRAPPPSAAGTARWRIAASS